MRVVVTLDEIEQWRSEFSAYPEALKALTEIEDCEGDLEDAALALAIQVGQEPNTSDRWIDGVAKRWRTVICQAEFRDRWEDDLAAEVVAALATQTSLPLRLALPIAIYVYKVGITEFCQPLTEKIQ